MKKIIEVSISLSLIISFTISNVPVYVTQIFSKDNTLRPPASAERPEDLQRGMSDTHQHPPHKPIRISESPEESHYWNLYYKLHELNRTMDSWFTGETLSAEEMNDSINEILKGIDEIASEVPLPLPEERSFWELSNINRAQKLEIARRLKQIEQVYKKSLKKSERSKDRKAFEELNRQLDSLNKQQIDTLFLNTAVRFALAKKFLGEEPKRKDSARPSQPQVGLAMSLIIGNRENMERITVELYWKRVRQYVAAFGQKIAQQIEAEGLFGEPVKTVSLADWDVNVLERGRVSVTMYGYETAVTSMGEERRGARIVRTYAYPDIVTACRGHVHIMESQNQEVLRIFTNMAQLHYIAQRIATHQETGLSKKVKEEALAGLELLHDWLKRGFVRPKQLGTMEIEKAIKSLERENINKAINFIINARNRLSERADTIRKSIRRKVYRRFAALNRERIKLVARDEEIKGHLRLARQLLGIEEEVSEEAIDNVNLNCFKNAKDVLITLLEKHFSKKKGLPDSPYAKAKEKIEKTIKLLSGDAGDDIRGLLEKRTDIKTKILPAIDSALEVLKIRDQNITSKTIKIQALYENTQNVVKRIETVQDLLRGLILPSSTAWGDQVGLWLGALDTSKNRVNSRLSLNNLNAVGAELTAFLNKEMIDIDIQDDIVHIIELISSTAKEVKDNLELLKQLHIPQRLVTNEAVVKILDAHWGEVVAMHLLDNFKKQRASKMKHLCSLDDINKRIGEILRSVYKNISSESAVGISAPITAGLHTPLTAKPSSAGLLRQAGIDRYSAGNPRTRSSDSKKTALRLDDSIVGEVSDTTANLINEIPDMEIPLLGSVVGDTIKSIRYPGKVLYIEVPENVAITEQTRKRYGPTCAVLAALVEAYETEDAKVTLEYEREKRKRGGGILFRISFSPVLAFDREADEVIMRLSKKTFQYNRLIELLSDDEAEESLGGSRDVADQEVIKVLRRKKVLDAKRKGYWQALSSPSYIVYPKDSIFLQNADTSIIYHDHPVSEKKMVEALRDEGVETDYLDDIPLIPSDEDVEEFYNSKRRFLGMFCRRGLVHYRCLDEAEKEEFVACIRELKHIFENIKAGRRMTAEHILTVKGVIETARRLRTDITFMSTGSHKPDLRKEVAAVSLINKAA